MIRKTIITLHTVCWLKQGFTDFTCSTKNETILDFIGLQQIKKKAYQKGLIEYNNETK